MPDGFESQFKTSDYHTLGLGHEAVNELNRAISKFSAMASPHEGWAVIHEELDELWWHVKANTGRSPEAREEAIQIAAMALRYVADLCDRPNS